MANLKTNSVELGNVTQANRSSLGTADGQVILNGTSNNLNYYSSNLGGWATVQRGAGDGSTAANAGSSGQQIKTEYPSSTTGYYYIKSSSMPNAIRMWVDMDEDGGGYDFWYTTSGPSVSYITETHAGVSQGLQLWEGRSPQCWRAAVRAAYTFDSGNFYQYFYGCGHVYKPNGGGNYTGCIMRSSYYGGNNCGEWRVLTGNRWWIRNNTHSEPNGDYNGNGFLQIYGGQFGYPFDVNTNMGFNDGGAYAIGNRYLLSTNVKT